MSKLSTRFVARATKGVGWRIWDKVQRQFWGPVFPRQPKAVIAELNGPKRGGELDQLVAEATRAGR